MDIESISLDEKKDLFERFLTYRRRMARMCAVQAIYLFDIRQRNNSKKMTREETKNEITLIYKNILYFYKNVFFAGQGYGQNKKTKKIDEKYFLDTILSVAKDIDRIDGIIAKYLNEKWTVARLDTVVRSILRCAVCEILYELKTEIPVLTSEYTNIAGHFFTGKEIGFINGIVDRIGKEKRTNES